MTAYYTPHSNTRAAKSHKKAQQSSSSSGDIYMADPRDTDVVVPVLGQTGAGKSTFINNLLGEKAAPVNEGLDPEATQVQSYVLTHADHPDRRLVVVDTPGFNSTLGDEASIWARVFSWLSNSYSGKKTFAGIIYLHEMSQAPAIAEAAMR